MEWVCPICQKICISNQEICEHAASLFRALNGKTIWRIRFFNKFYYQFLSDEQYEALLRGKTLIFSEVAQLFQFHAQTWTGVNALGKKVSIFE